MCCCVHQLVLRIALEYKFPITKLTPLCRSRVQRVTKRIDLLDFFSIARLIALMLAIDLPGFCLPMRCASSTDPVAKNLLTRARMVCFEGLPCLLALLTTQVKMFHKLCLSKWNWFCFGIKPNHLNPLFYTIFFVVSHLATFYTVQTML